MCIAVNVSIQVYYLLVFSTYQDDFRCYHIVVYCFHFSPVRTLGIPTF